MNVVHSPSPDFVSHLEWELQSTLRRRSACNGTAATWRFIRKPHWVATLALAFGSFFIGGAGSYAALCVADQRMAALHIARGEALLDIAKARREPIAHQKDNVALLFQQGSATERELRTVEAQLAQADAEVQTQASNLEETRLTGAPPNDSLSAPLVRGRDFVSERLSARRVALQRQVELAAAHAQRMHKLDADGSAMVGEVLAAQTQVDEAEQQVALLDQRHDLRASFVEGELSASRVGLEDMRLGITSMRETTKRHAEVLELQRARVAKLCAGGLLPDSELQTLDSELQANQAQRELAELELNIIDQKIRETSGE